MSNLSDDIADETMVVLGLLLLRELLFMSNYPDEVKKQLNERAHRLIDKIRERREAGFDFYGNPYGGSGV